jgi:cyclopropane fatty-acyl-phospholipid synthase-like methyltransferase
MPSLDWNRKWSHMIAGFVPGAAEPHWGDRWGDPESERPLRAVRRRFIDPYLRPGQTVLEIGSGGGRWTQYFQRAGTLIVVEYNPEAFAYLRRRFPHRPFTAYRTRGYEMAGVAPSSVDFAFTFDVFVHLEPEGIGAYLREIERVLKPGAVAVVHYGNVRKRFARDNPGFSRMTRRRMDALIGQTRLSVLDHDSTLLPHSNLVALGR